MNKCGTVKREGDKTGVLGVYERVNGSIEAEERGHEDRDLGECS